MNNIDPYHAKWKSKLCNVWEKRIHQQTAHAYMYNDIISTFWPDRLHTYEDMSF